MGKAVYGIANSESQAAKMVSDLKRNGFRESDISVLFPDKTGRQDFGHEMQTKAPEGALAGIVGAGILGACLGWIMGTGLITIPPLGLVAVAGPVIAALAGAAACAAIGGVAGALIGSTIPKIVAKRYEGKISAVNILISAHAETIALARKAKQIFFDAGCREASISREAEAPSKRLYAT